MRQLAKWLQRACTELGLGIELGYKVTLPNMPELTAVAQIPNLGAANGMLVFSSYEEIGSLTQRLLDAGYAFSVLDGPLQHEEFDLQSFKDMFTDWGWSGELRGKPSWM